MRRVIFGCADPQGGAAGGLLNLCKILPQSQCDVTGGVMREDAPTSQSFFRDRRSRETETLSKPEHGNSYKV
jgi:tRNA(adenine34) deaminase